jgi:hypothetical protein
MTESRPPEPHESEPATRLGRFRSQLVRHRKVIAFSIIDLIVAGLDEESPMPWWARAILVGVRCLIGVLAGSRDE